MAAVEYDVLVKLHVDRQAGKALGDAARPLTRGLKDVERQQTRAARAAAQQQKQQSREFLRQQVSHERAIQKGAANQRKAVLEDTRARIRGKRLLLAEQRKADAASKASWGETKGKASAALGGMSSVGQGMQGVGLGPLAGWASKAGAIIGAAVATALVASISAASLAGIGDNIKAEQQKGSIGTTLQLYDFNTRDQDGAKRTDQAQFDENLENARWYQQELIRIADAAPGDIEQVSTLFQGLLPGMASITQDADRIMDLTQKASLLSAVLDNDFKTVGAQGSRILTGGAGAEFETWNRLAPTIRQAGIEMGVFKKNQKLGEDLTGKFNKLDPEQRLQLFEKGVARLGKPVADYFENSFEGITSQASSSLKTLRKELGRGGFEAIKLRVKQSNKSGILNQKSDEYKKLKEGAGFLGDLIGKGITRGIDVAERGAIYVANNWERIVDKAYMAAETIKTGAKIALDLLAVRMGMGAGVKAGGAALSGVSSVVSTAASVAQLGVGAIVAAPALIALGIVAGGFTVILGGVAAYVVKNLETLGRTFEEWRSTSQPVIDAFWLAVEDIGVKFAALGEYFIGPADSTETFTTVTELATDIVYGLTDAFSWLLGATADVVEGFGWMMDNLDNFVSTFTGNGGNAAKIGMIEQMIARNGDPKTQADREHLANLQQQIKDEKSRMSNYGETATGYADKIRAGKLRFDLAGANRTNIGEALYQREQKRLAETPIGPQKPSSMRPDKKPPNVNVKVTNHNHFNIRDTDPNAVVAAFNKGQGRQLAVPLASALAAARRGT